MKTLNLGYDQAKEYFVEELFGKIAPESLQRFINSEARKQKKDVKVKVAKIVYLDIYAEWLGPDRDIIGEYKKKELAKIENIIRVCLQGDAKKAFKMMDEQMWCGSTGMIGDHKGGLESFSITYKSIRGIGQKLGFTIKPTKSTVKGIKRLTLDERSMQ